MPKWFQSKVLAKKVWTEGLFTLSIDGTGVEPFEPGQFLHLAVFPDGIDADADDDTREKQRVNRPYSVASPYGESLEFFIIRVDDGELTPHLWKLEPGDDIEVSQKAAGRFTLEKTPDAENLWLIATGTGLAPYIAMLRTEEPWQRYKKIVVVHGVRHANDLAYTDELQAIENVRLGAFRFVQALTRETADGTLNGRIPALVESGELESAADCRMTKEDSSVMLCGNPAMLDSMEEILGKRSMTRHRSKSPGQIVLERYW
ncbi:ferredoxin--NADP reductase [Mariniblastus fucicola]|uniref:ferredoxin--NADP(+) reductase n=1 Tax=Mariniblastus fucicola TaxID=980251 RepID=A0A5B9P6W4_9BACT|nr:ferredoxin--NADP reductase [Mariniblastus fucicola]QEG20670.1 Ferredoxin--NADP reductase [Mariniblastus fucicola]